MKSSRYIIIHKHRKAAVRSSRFMTILHGFGLTLLGVILSFLVGIGVFYAVFTQSFPSFSLLEQHYSSKPEPTRFYARDGETLLFTLSYEDFLFRDLEICASEGEGCFPETFLKAARITRDVSVGQGDKYSLAEEMVRNVYSEFISESRWPDLTAKMLSLQVRMVFGDEQLEAWYYNNAWFGQMAFGLDAASRLYLDKPAEELNHAECVLMSAVVNAPMLNPIDSKGALRDFYLNQLVLVQRAGLFTEDEADALAHSNFIVFEPPRYTGGAEPDIITLKALNAAMNFYGRERVERGGLKVITSEDDDLQSYLRCVTSVDNEAENTACPLSTYYSEEVRRSTAEALRTAPISMAVIDVKNGQILAALEAVADDGNHRSYENSLRTYPVGSLINYFEALTAFVSGSSPSTLLWDLPDMYDTADREESDEPFHGPVQLRDALVQDYRRALNVHLQQFGRGAVQRNAALFGLVGGNTPENQKGFTQRDSYTAETMAYSLIPFAVFGDQTGSTAGGTMHPVSILRVELEDGETEFPQPETHKSLIAENLAYLVHNVFLQESGSLSLSDRPSALKIGTIPGDSARWISGYTTELSCTVRAADPRIVSAFMTDEDRVQEAAEVLWRSVMELAHQGRPASGWEIPAGISQVRICLPSGKLPTAACRETGTEVFLQGNEPYEYDEYYVEAPINRENRMLATRYTDPEKVNNEVFLDLPDEADEWAAANGIEQAPTAYDPIRNESHNSQIQIESPAVFQSFSDGDKIEVIVRLSLNQLTESMQVSIGSGMYPTQWQEMCSGGTLENGQWLLCTLDASDLEPGLYVLRTAFTLSNQSYQSAESYFQILK